LGHRNASFEASWLLDDERNVQQSRAAESGSQLEPLLKCLAILIVRGVFNGDGVVTLANLAALLHLALLLDRHIFRLWGEGGSEINFTTSFCGTQFI
jgi:hypothetical protein